MRQQINEATASRETVVMEHREDLFPQIVINDASGNMVGHYSIPSGAYIMVEDGAQVKRGTILARTPRQSTKVKDITGGLPRVAELFEARRPKEAAEIAKIDGVVSLGKLAKGKRALIIRDPDTNSTEEHSLPANKQIVVFDGEFVKKGQPLTEGSVVPQEILEVCGPQDLQEYLVNEIQQVYRLQGVEINDKHIEVIVRQMLQKVRITEPGDTQFLYGEQVEKAAFIKENSRVVAEGGKPAEAQPIILGITKASLETDSFISAASFQDTTRVLTDAATLARVDPLKGFKENVIMGHLIPAGTGYHKRLSVRLKKLGKEIPPEPTATAPGDDALAPAAPAPSTGSEVADAIAALGLGK
jgi:DNA-directed RNA polymerase subunit beta'